MQSFIFKIQKYKYSRINEPLYLFFSSQNGIVSHQKKKKAYKSCLNLIMCHEI